MRGGGGYLGDLFIHPMWTGLTSCDGNIFFTDLDNNWYQFLSSSFFLGGGCYVMTAANWQLLFFFCLCIIDNEYMESFKLGGNKHISARNVSGYICEHLKHKLAGRNNFVDFN